MITSFSELLDQMPPNDHEAERSVLGSILLDADKLDDVSVFLRAEDFHSAVHQTIFATMLELRNAGRGIDHRLLLSELTRRQLINDDLKASYLAEIVDCVPSPSNAVWYAEHVKDCSLLRALRHAGVEMVYEALKGDGAPRERVARAESKALSLLEQGTNRNVVPIRDVLIDALAEIDARIARGTVSGLTTGYVQLDGVLGGMRAGELIIIAGRPGSGKSALASNIVEHACLHCGKCTLFVSLEMNRMEMGERLLASVAMLDGHAMRSGRLSSDEQRQLIEANASISLAPMFVDDTPQRNLVEIASAARRLKRLEGLALLVIDYLQLIEPDNRRDSREQQVAVISRRLKQLARELKIPVVCLAQLNRELEKGTDHTPKLAHLRESGAVEQDADVVILVHREDLYREQRDWDNKANIIVAKNRNGQRGRVTLDWNGARTRFDTPASHFNPDNFRYPGAFE